MVNLGKHAVVLCSGGQDSITSLHWAKKHIGQVDAICFHYGQNHSIELDKAQEICDSLGITLKRMDITEIMALSKSALTEKGADVNKLNEDGLPSSFVPNRNQMFLTIAHSYAQLIGADSLVTGVCQTDYSGYYDCRNIFVKHLERTLNLGSFGNAITPEWIAGFIEGEGCFTRGSYKTKEGKKVYPQFSLEQTDLSILEQLKNFIGVGNINERKGKKTLGKLPSWEYKIGYKDCNYIANLITRFGTNGGRQQNRFIAWLDEHKDYFDSTNPDYRVGGVEKKGIPIHTPLMFLDKADTFNLADELGCLEVILHSTMTCYNGSTSRNDWGMGCGECPACKLRANGYKEYLERKERGEYEYE